MLLYTPLVLWQIKLRFSTSLFIENVLMNKGSVALHANQHCEFFSQWGQGMRYYFNRDNKKFE